MGNPSAKEKAAGTLLFAGADQSTPEGRAEILRRKNAIEGKGPDGIQGALAEEKFLHANLRDMASGRTLQKLIGERKATIAAKKATDLVTLAKGPRQTLFDFLAGRVKRHVRGPQDGLTKEEGEEIGAQLGRKGQP